MTQLMESYKKFKTKFSDIFWQLPQQYFWVFGMVTGIFSMYLLTVNNDAFYLMSSTDQIVIFSMASFLLGLLFTGLMLVLVGSIIFFVVLAPVIRDTSKEVKTVFVDYPKIMKEGVVNDKTAEIVMNYIGVVLKDRLDKIREALKKETKEEISNAINPAHKAYQIHDIQIKNLNETKVDKSELEKVEKTFMDEYRKVNIKYQEERELRIQVEKERDEAQRQLDEQKKINEESKTIIADKIQGNNKIEDNKP